MLVNDVNNWTLSLLLSGDNLWYILRIDDGAENARAGHLALVDSDVNGVLKTLEDTVYDNGFLLDDYRRVKVAVRAPRFSLLPGEYRDRDEDAHRAHRATTTSTDVDIITAYAERNDIVAAFEIPRGVYNFVQRTFNSPPVTFHLLPLLEHYKTLSEVAATARVYLNFHSADTMDIAVYDAEARLLMANTVTFRTIDDAAYYALNAWRIHHLDNDSDHEIVITGDNTCRAEVAQLLRRYVKRVTLAIPPAAIIRLGDEAQNAPLELQLLAL